MFSKRPLLFAAVFFVAGILMALFKINISVLAILGVLLVITAIFRRKHTLFCFLLILCSLLGVFKAQSSLREQTSVINHYYGTQKHLIMTVTEFSENGKVIAGFSDGKDKIRIYLNVKTTPSLVPGQIIEGDVSIYSPTRSKTTRNDFSSYLCSRGVYLYGITEEIKTEGDFAEGFMGQVYACRRYIDKVGKRHFSGDTRALFNAMVMGDKGLLSDDLYNALQGAGLNHIAVVSGMHLSILIAAVMVLCRRIFGNSRWGSLAAILFAFILMLITGAGASVVRAFIMCVLYQLSILLYRENDSFSSLGFAAFIMLYVNPFLVYNPGFILSVLSVTGIFLFYQSFQKGLFPFVPNRLVDSISLTLSATMGVAVAVAYYFGIITPYAVLSNLLVFLPATAFVVMGMLFTLVSNIPIIGVALKFIINILSKAIISVCRFVADIPNAIISVDGDFAAVFFVWALLFIAILTNKQSVKRRIGVIMAFVLLAGVGLCLGPGKPMQFSFAAYGQNTMTSISLDNGEKILMDCPDSYDARYMEINQGEPFLWAVLTTANYDELLSLAQNGKLEAVIVPEGVFTGMEKYDFEKAWERVKARVLFLPDGERIGIGGAQVEFFTADSAKKGVKLYYQGKTFVSLQGTDSKYVEKLLKCGEKLSCDYLKLPFLILPEGADAEEITDGKIFK